MLMNAAAATPAVSSNGQEDHFVKDDIVMYKAAIKQSPS